MSDDEARADPPMTDEHRWGEPIPPERQAELDARLQTWLALVQAEHVEHRSPFDKRGWHDQLSGADVFYLATRALAGGLDADGTTLAHAADTLRGAVRIESPTPSYKRVSLQSLHLEGADLRGAHLEGAILQDAHLEGTNLGDLIAGRTRLEGAVLDNTHLEGATLYKAHLERALLNEAHFERASLQETCLQEALLVNAHLDGSRLDRAHLEGAVLQGAYLHGAVLVSAHLEGALLTAAHLEGEQVSPHDLARILPWVTDFPQLLPPADLRETFLSEATALNGITLGDAAYGYVRMADVRWGGVNLAVVQMPPAHLLGDERLARNPVDGNGRPKDHVERLREFLAAVRANRQLAVALETQGLNEDAGRFAYNAQLLQQQVFWRQCRYGPWLFSRLLDAVAGYGYKPVRGLIAYGAVIIGFLLAYMRFGVVDASCSITGMSTTGSLVATCSPAHTLTFQEALVFSLTSFHGRGFFPGGLGLGSPITLLAAIEAVIGLIVEISFIATFTQRFFGTK